MIEYDYVFEIPKDFTGICFVKCSNSVRHYENGLLHNTNGPALSIENYLLQWNINGELSREDGPAVEYSNGDIKWYYKDEFYGYNTDYSIDSWQQLIRELQLQIFE